MPIETRSYYPGNNNAISYICFVPACTRRKYIYCCRLPLLLVSANLPLYFCCTLTVLNMSSTPTRIFLQNCFQNMTSVTLAVECMADVYSTLFQANTETQCLQYICPRDSRTLASRDSTPCHDPCHEAVENIGYVCLLKQARNPGHRYSFGRNERTNNVVLPANSRTSRLHFQIYLNSKNAWMIADHSSTGTVVNGEGLAGPGLRERIQLSAISINCLAEVALNPKCSTKVKAGSIEFRIHVVADPEGLRPWQPRGATSSSYGQCGPSLSRGIVSSSSDSWSLFQINPNIWSEYYILEQGPPAGDAQVAEGVAIRKIMRKTTGEYGIGKCFNADVQGNGFHLYRKGKEILEQGKHKFIDGFLGDCIVRDKPRMSTWQALRSRGVFL